MKPLYLLIGCLLFGTAIFFLYFRERRKSQRLLEYVLQELDDAIAGNLQDLTYDESLDAAIRERLNRVVEIAGMRRDKAEKERDTVKSLISDIAHQVRTPLSNILLYSELLEESLNSVSEQYADADGPASGNPAPKEEQDNPLESALQMAEKIRRQSEKLDFFVHELTQTSYAEQEMFSIHPQRVSAAELVDRACQGVEVSSMKKDIHIHRVEDCMYSGDHTSSENGAYSAHFSDQAGSAIVTCTTDSVGDSTSRADCTCFADPRWTVEALVNILENAIKYSPQSSDVEISVIPYEAFVCIAVKDYGIGIPESEQGAIFGRFYRSSQVSDTPGFGIGLYLAREVLSRQGGYIKVQSAPGAGSTFQVFLSKLSPLRKI